MDSADGNCLGNGNSIDGDERDAFGSYGYCTFFRNKLGFIEHFLAMDDKITWHECPQKEILVTTI